MKGFDSTEYALFDQFFISRHFSMSTYTRYLPISLSPFDRKDALWKVKQKMIERPYFRLNLRRFTPKDGRSIICGITFQVITSKLRNSMDNGLAVKRFRVAKPLGPPPINIRGLSYFSKEMVHRALEYSRFSTRTASAKHSV